MPVTQTPPAATPPAINTPAPVAATSRYVADSKTVTFDSAGEMSVAPIDVQSGDRLTITCNKTHLADGHTFTGDLIIHVYTGGKSPKHYRDDTQPVSSPFPADFGADYSVELEITKVDGNRAKIPVIQQSAIFTAVRNEKIGLRIAPAPQGRLYLKNTTTDFRSAHDQFLDQQANYWAQAHEVIGRHKNAVTKSSSVNQITVTVKIEHLQIVPTATP